MGEPKIVMNTPPNLEPLMYPDTMLWVSLAVAGAFILVIHWWYGRDR